MKEWEILEKIDEIIAMHILENVPDESMRKRRTLIDSRAERFISDEFLDKMNGMVFRGNGGRSYSVIACSVFLDEVCVKTLLKQDKNQKILLFTHHFLDVDCGRPGTETGVGFSFVGVEALRELYHRGIQICSIHLPLDLNQSLVNTHRIFARQLGLRLEEDLLEYPFGGMGYVACSAEFSRERIASLFPEVTLYGKAAPEEDPKARIAVVAGMISSPEMLKKIEERNCKILICGDVLLRNGSERKKQMEAYLRQTSLSIYCVSHYQSEFWALKELARQVTGAGMKTLMIYDGAIWK